jgi:rhodanese-related sulfurtransferase
MAAMAIFVAVTHICLPSIVYTRLFERVGDVPEVSAGDAFVRLRDGAVVVDVRDAEFYDAGHIQGAIHAPSSGGDLRSIELDADQTLLVICQSGAMSLKAAKELREQGYLGACSVRGGMSSWLKARLPLASQETVSP